MPSGQSAGGPLRVRGPWRGASLGSRLVTPIRYVTGDLPVGDLAAQVLGRHPNFGPLIGTNANRVSIASSLRV